MFIADLDRGPVIVHQGEYDWPPVGSGRYGFTGRRRAYEPMRDGELEYWCEAAEWPGLLQLADGKAPCVAACFLPACSRRLGPRMVK